MELAPAMRVLLIVLVWDHLWQVVLVRIEMLKLLRLARLLSNLGCGLIRQEIRLVSGVGEEIFLFWHEKPGLGNWACQSLLCVTGIRDYNPRLNLSLII
jgi:hypothetical protein